MKYVINRRERIPNPEKLKDINNYLSQNKILKRKKDKEIIKPYKVYSSLVKREVDKFINVFDMISGKVFFLCLFLILILVGLVSIVKGFPYTNISVMGIVVHPGWITSNPGLFVITLVLSFLLSVGIYVYRILKSINSLRNILIEDCDAETFLQVAECGVGRKNNKYTKKIFNTMYIAALCVMDMNEDAYRFAETIDNEELKLYVILNQTDDKENFNLYYNKLDNKKQYKLKNLYINEEYDSVVEYVRTKIERRSEYNSLLGDLYLAKTYYKQEEYEKALLFASRCVAEGKTLPKIYKEALEIYKELLHKLSQQ